MSSVRPNVVVFISHDSGRFLEQYGHDTVQTPNFGRLAEMGTTFDNAFCTTPLCAPARSALLTGLFPHQNGMMGLPSDTLGGWDLVRKERHLARVFREAGYESVLCGFEHETHDFWSAGFERSLHGSGDWHNGGLPLAGAGREIDDWLAQRREPAGSRTPSDAAPERPFYLQIGCQDTHREWSKTSRPFRDRGVWKAPYLIESEEIDAEMSEQQGAINTLDAGVGEVLDALEANGALENTILIFTTDHGIDFPRAKGTLFDPGVEVFLFAAWTGGGWSSGVREERLVSHVDLYPTLLESCGIAVPDDCAGRSLVPMLRDGGSPSAGGDVTGGVPDVPATDSDPAVYFEKIYHDNYDPMRALRTQRYKYVLNFDAQTLYDVRIATAPRYNWFRFPIKKDQREELYDLEHDPDESNNLVKDPASDGLRLELKQRLAAWMQSTNDPLLEGPIPSPYHLRISAEMKELAAEG